jgi:hypothetical protein
MASTPIILFLQVPTTTGSLTPRPIQYPIRVLIQAWMDKTGEPQTTRLSNTEFQATLRTTVALQLHSCENALSP